MQVYCCTFPLTHLVELIRSNAVQVASASSWGTSSKYEEYSPAARQAVFGVKRASPLRSAASLINAGDCHLRKEGSSRFSGNIKTNIAERHVAYEPIHFHSSAKLSALRLTASSWLVELKASLKISGVSIPTLLSQINFCRVSIACDNRVVCWQQVIEQSISNLSLSALARSAMVCSSLPNL